MSPRLYHFDEPVPPGEIRSLLGGKGSGLRQLIAWDYDVPYGFTITTNAVAELTTEPTSAQEFWREVETGVERLAQKTGQAWGSGPTPLTLAVRSGAAESRPGQMRTLLNCGWTRSLAERAASPGAWFAFATFLSELLPTESDERTLQDQVLAATDQESPETLRQLTGKVLTTLSAIHGPLDDTPNAWLRLAVERVAASSRAAHNGHTATAITVQAMFPAEVSGVLRSRDPIDPTSDQVVIEAVPGCGSQLMSGAVTPYVVSLPWKPSSPVAAVVSETFEDTPSGNLLPVRHRNRLREIAITLEQTAGRPVEVEWGIASDRLVLFQYRVAQDLQTTHPPTNEETVRLHALARAGRMLWVRHQLAESLPLPTPLSWSLWDQFMSPDGGLGTLYRRLGYAPRSYPDRRGCLELIAGRIHVDADRWAQMICRSYPWRHNRHRLIAAPNLIYEPPDELDPQRLDPWFLLKWPHLVWVLWRANRTARRLARSAEQQFRDEVWPVFHRGLQQIDRERDATSASAASRIASLESIRRWLFDDQLPLLLLPGWLGLQAWERVCHAVRRQTATAEADRLLPMLLAEVEVGPHGAKTSADPTETALDPGLWESLSLELSAADAPEPGEEATASLPHWDVTSSRTARYESLLRKLASEFGVEPPSSVQSDLQTALTLLPLRSAGRRLFLAGYRRLKTGLAELAESTGRCSQLYQLTWNELLAAGGASVTADVLAERQRVREAWGNFTPPAVIDGGAKRPLERPPPAASSGPWTVRPLSPGTTRGKVWQPSRVDDDCPQGVIVVAETLDAPAILRWKDAAGFIVERGGLLSHAAVTARQLGRPMGMLAQATMHYRPGSAVYLNAEEGVALLVDEKSDVAS